MGEKAVGRSIAFTTRSTSGPFSSLSANTRCRSGSCRNFSSWRTRSSKLSQPRMLDDVVAVSADLGRPEALREATAQFRSWKSHWQPFAPKTVTYLERDLPELLNFLECLPAHRIKVRTTNVMERAFWEVGRRTRPMSCFQNNRSSERIIYSDVEHLNRRWKDVPLREFRQKA